MNETATLTKRRTRHDHHRGMLAEMERSAALAREVGVVGLTAGTPREGPPFVTVEGRSVVSFASCDYLGMSQLEAAKAAARAAVDTWGVQFSTSPAYLKVDLYEELAMLLAAIGGNPHVAIAPTTSLAHQGTLPVLVDVKDLVVVDHQAHSSLGQTMHILRALGVEVTSVRHSNVDQLEALLVKNPGRRVWYVADGVYSMFGDVAPLDDLQALSQRHENLWMYFDDAHGFGWTGPYGRGPALSRFTAHPRTVVSVSLNKAFAAGGGATFFPNAQMRAACQLAGIPFVTSGPLKPSELGAGVAVAKAILGEGAATNRVRLHCNIAHTMTEAERLGLTFETSFPTPIFYVRIGATDDAIAASRKLLDQGHLTNPTCYPIVPKGASGLRAAVTALQEPEQITAMLEAIAAVFG